MKSIKLLAIFLLYFLSMTTSDISFTMNPRRRPPEEEWEQQGSPTRPCYEHEEDEDEEKEEYDEKEDSEDEDEMDIEENYLDAMQLAVESQAEVERLVLEYSRLSQNEKNQKLLEVVEENYDSLEQLEALLQVGANPNTINTKEPDKGVTPLFQAAENGRLDIVNRLLEDESTDINLAATGDLAGATPVWVATLGKHIEVVRALLEANAAVNIDNPGKVVKDFGDIVWLAVDAGDFDLLEMLLEAGAEKNAFFEDSFPLLKAVSRIQKDNDNYAKMATLLIEFEANVNQSIPVTAEDDAGKTPLHAAVEANAPTVVRALISEEANLGAPMLDEYRNGQTPLYIAVYYGHPQIVDLLLKAGANILVVPTVGAEGTKTLFHMAKYELEEESTEDHQKVYNMLLKKFEQDPDKKDQKGNTELHYLAEVRDDTSLGVIKDLLRHGGNLLVKNSQGKTVLDKAVEGRNREVIKLFLDPIEEDDPDQALLVAIENGLLTDVTRLLRGGADANIEENGVTPLMYAVQQSASTSLAMINQLLQYGAIIDKTDSDGKTALAYAAEAGKNQAFRALLARGADPSKIPASVTLTEEIKQILQENVSQKQEDSGEEQRIIDPITQDDITDIPDNQKITLGQYTYLKKTIMNHILSRIASKDFEEISDPMRIPIGSEKITALANHFNIPVNQLNMPSLNADLREIPQDFDEQTYLVIKRDHPNQALNLFKAMIASDTLRSLERRLQVKENNLQMYPEGDEKWEEGERAFTEREVQVLKDSVKSKLRSFGYE